jgi:hypothetical protein
VNNKVAGSWLSTFSIGPEKVVTTFEKEIEQTFTNMILNGFSH